MVTPRAAAVHSSADLRPEPRASARPSSHPVARLCRKRPSQQCNLLAAVTNYPMSSQSRDLKPHKGYSMNRYALAASTLSAALGVALALSAPLRAADMPKA